MKSNRLIAPTLLALLVFSCKNKDRSASCRSYTQTAGSTIDCQLVKVLDPEVSVYYGNLTDGFQTSRTLDLNGDSIDDVMIGAYKNSDGSAVYIRFTHPDIQTQAAWLNEFDHNKELDRNLRRSALMARVLNPSARLCERANWQDMEMVYFSLHTDSGPDATVGEFSRAYIPIRIGTDNYGWLNMSFENSTLTIHDYAFERTF